MIEGLTGDRWALISKVHHCMVDGVSGTDLMVQLLDSSRRVRRPRPPSRGCRHRSRAHARLAFDGVRRCSEHSRRARCRRPVRWHAVLASRMSCSAVPVEGGGGARPGDAADRRRSPSRERSAAIAVGPRRAPTLPSSRRSAACFGGTVNDVVARRRRRSVPRSAARARRSRRRRATVRTLVPVSVRAADDRTANNQVSAIIAELAVGIADPIERLRQREWCCRSSRLHQPRARTAPHRRCGGRHDRRLVASRQLEMTLWSDAPAERDQRSEEPGSRGRAAHLRHPSESSATSRRRSRSSGWPW